ncbi:MAG: hypothetical protein EBY16_05545 [Gammaproteobacteria bacterium]|nr:hypothetical protein [Gammaproteobacteria bacterium]
MLKKNKLLSAILLLSGSASFAGTMGAVCQEGNLTIPCDMKKWSISGQALYMQMTTNNIFANSSLGGSSGAESTRGINPSWTWGFQLEGAYQFSNGKDINLNWYRLRGSDAAVRGASTYLGNAFTVTDPAGINQPGDYNTRYTVGNGTLSQNSAWDMVNIEHGRQINFDEDFHARVHFGGEFSRIMQNANITNLFTQTPLTGSSSITNYQNNITSVYNGFGPRLGLDLVYDTPYHIGFYGKGAVGILAGTAKTQYNSSTTAINPISGQVAAFIPARMYFNVNRVVTSFDAKLGLNYTYTLAQGDIAVDAGWMWVDYLSPLTARDFVSGAQSNPFAIQGVYFGGKWTGDFI